MASNDPSCQLKPNAQLSAPAPVTPTTVLDEKDDDSCSDMSDLPPSSALFSVWAIDVRCEALSQQQKPKPVPHGNLSVRRDAVAHLASMLCPTQKQHIFSMLEQHSVISASIFHPVHSSSSSFIVQLRFTTVFDRDAFLILINAHQIKPRAWEVGIRMVRGTINLLFQGFKPYSIEEQFAYWQAQIPSIVLTRRDNDAVYGLPASVADISIPFVDKHLINKLTSINEHSPLTVRIPIRSPLVVCNNCWQIGHKKSECKSESKCGRCKAAHDTHQCPHLHTSPSVLPFSCVLCDGNHVTARCDLYRQRSVIIHEYNPIKAQQLAQAGKLNDTQFKEFPGVCTPLIKRNSTIWPPAEVRINTKKLLSKSQAFGAPKASASVNNTRDIHTTGAQKSPNTLQPSKPRMAQLPEASHNNHKQSAHPLSTEENFTTVKSRRQQRRDRATSHAQPAASYAQTAAAHAQNASASLSHTQPASETSPSIHAPAINAQTALAHADIANLAVSQTADQARIVRLEKMNERLAQLVETQSVTMSELRTLVLQTQTQSQQQIASLTSRVNQLVQLIESFGQKIYMNMQPLVKAPTLLPASIPFISPVQFVPVALPPVPLIQTPSKSTPVTAPVISPAPPSITPSVNSERNSNSSAAQHSSMPPPSAPASRTRHRPEKDDRATPAKKSAVGHSTTTPASPDIHISVRAEKNGSAALANILINSTVQDVHNSVKAAQQQARTSSRRNSATLAGSATSNSTPSHSPPRPRQLDADFSDTQQ